MADLAVIISADPLFNYSSQLKIQHYLHPISDYKDNFILYLLFFINLYPHQNLYYSQLLTFQIQKSVRILKSMRSFSSTPKSHSQSRSKNNSFKDQYKQKPSRYESKNKSNGDREKDVLNNTSIVYLHRKIVELEKNAIIERRKMINNSKKQLNKSWRSLCQILKLQDPLSSSQKQFPDTPKENNLEKELREQQRILDACLSLIIKERISLEKENIQIQKISNLCLRSKNKYRQIGSSAGSYNNTKEKENQVNPEQVKVKQKNTKSKLKVWRERNYFKG